MPMMPTTACDFGAADAFRDAAFTATRHFAERFGDAEYQFDYRHFAEHYDAEGFAHFPLYEHFCRVIS